MCARLTVIAYSDRVRCCIELIRRYARALRMYGVARLFLQAGTANVIGSLAQQQQQQPHSHAHSVDTPNSSPQTVSGDNKRFHFAACNESLQTSILSQCTVVFLSLPPPLLCPTGSSAPASILVASICGRSRKRPLSAPIEQLPHDYCLVCVCVCVHASLKPIECRLSLLLL